MPRDSGPRGFLDLDRPFYGSAFTDREVQGYSSRDQIGFFALHAVVGLSDFAGDPWRPISLLLEVDPAVARSNAALINRIVSAECAQGMAWTGSCQAFVERLGGGTRFVVGSSRSGRSPIR